MCIGVCGIIINTVLKEKFMSGGLITRLALDEEYVVHVLGFDRKMLYEGRYNMCMHQDILEAHMIAEGWFSDGVEYLKKKGVEGYEAVKDKALEVPNAIKQFGEDATGVVAAITAMINDPEEMKAYASGIYGAIRSWPRKLVKNLSYIAKWMESHGMPTFAKGVRKIIDLLKELWLGTKKVGGWASAVSMMAFGLAVKYIEEEFGILDKVETMRKYIADPQELVSDIKDEIGDMASDALDDIKDFFKGEITAVVENSELFKQITSFLSEKLGFLQTIKDKFLDLGKQVAGKALEQFAGPIGWLKQLYELFQSSSWVLGHLTNMLVSMKI